MKLSKLMHVISVLAGLIGVVMTALVVLFWPDGAVLLGVTKGVMMFCSITFFLIAIWLQIATIHHMMLEKNREIV
jgi:hypothetical protein